MIRVLIADDSPTLRQLIRAILESDPELVVVGEAHNGEEAIALCHRLDPDIITMDINMPGVDGYEAISYIMAETPRPIVVLTSTASDQELMISSRAPEIGALMVAGKPHGLPGADPEADQLIAHVKAMAGVKVVRRHRRTVQKAPVKSYSRQHLWPASGLVKLIALGASTGGPPALQVILSDLPADMPVPIVVVQHISPGFMGGLARWLNDTTPLQVKVAKHSEPLRSGTVYLAQDDRHLEVTPGGQIWFTDSARVNGHRPSVTVLFESVARYYGKAAMGVLLTGMGVDGALGLKAIHDAGGYTIAQNEATCIVFGMPKEAINLGAVEEVLPLEHIGNRLRELII